MSPEERKIQGPRLGNGLRDAVTAALAARKAQIGDAALDARLAGETVDVTLPPRAEPQGSVHPISQVLEEIILIFADMGFAVAEGPDIEFDDYNFTRLNIPPDHPARQMQDTLHRASDRRLFACATYPHLAGAGAHHAEPQAADPDHLSGPDLSGRFRRHPFAHVPSG